jgi:hypothetical protein
VNSYADLSFATEYFANRTFADKWNSTEESERQKYLATASGLIEIFCTFFDDDGMAFVYSASNAPEFLKKACCEQALYMLNLGKDPTQADKKTTLGIRSTDGTTFDKEMSADILCVQCRVILERNGVEIDSRALPGSAGSVDSGFVIK